MDDLQPPAHNQPSDAEDPNQVVRWQSAIWTTPLVIPDLMRQYEEILPGLAERLTRLVEDEAHHRRKMDSRRESRFYFGLGLASGIAALFLLGAVYCAKIGYPWLGAALGGADLAALVYSFLRGAALLQGWEDDEVDEETLEPEASRTL